jgi:hypothetical protein
MLELLESRPYSTPVTYDDLDMINEALKILPEDESNYPYLQLKGNILEKLGEPVKAKICYYLSSKMYDKVEKAEKQLKQLDNPNETFIVISGTNHYQYFKPFHKGVIMDLVKEPDNKHDKDAIRVEINGETVGYVANSEWTLINETKSATEIKNMQSTNAEFLFIILDCYVVAKLI